MTLRPMPAVLLIALAACSDPAAPPRAEVATAASAVAQDIPAGAAVTSLPSVRVTSTSGRPVPGVRVVFTAEAGNGAVSGTDQLTDRNGTARLGSWILDAEPGTNRVTATIPELPGITLVFEATALPTGCTRLVTLDGTAGAFVRLRGAGEVRYPCLLIPPGNADHLVLLENIASLGPFAASLFPGTPGDTTFAYSIAIEPSGVVAAPPATALRLDAPADEPEHTWSADGRPLRELTPPYRPHARSSLVRDGRLHDQASLVADAQVGDTIQVFLEPLPRLGITAGTQNAVIRFVSSELIIAEDVRLATTLVRENGAHNTPIAEADLAAIAAEYAAVARVQGDLFFENRHNANVEAKTPPRVIAVHSLMPDDDIWGYTHSLSDYFVWDYWAGTDGSTKGLNQHPHRVADNLFMHEIAHMRHFGLLQRNGLGAAQRGNRWLVEGFARFSERLPVAARILGTVEPSRTGNIVLPRNPAFGNSYFMDDVPTYLNASSSMYFGYQTSAFVFDYFADQVASSGGDWKVALRDFLIAGYAQGPLDAVVAKWLPGTSFRDLFSRSRIALYTDDLEAGMPAWTQYQQFRLRESRPAPAQSAAQDPRTRWPTLSTEVPIAISGTVASGGATGYVLRSGALPAIVRLTGPDGGNATIAAARIR